MGPLQFVSVTMAKAIENIESQAYVIPVIQRDFVWKPAQVENLFDSVMRDYPIGTFLFWKVPHSALQQYPFFEFAKDVERGKFSPRQVRGAAGSTAIAVLDGQQRLTSFLMALKGSYNSRGRGRSGMLRRELYLDLLAFNEGAGEDKPAYSFRFMTEGERERQDDVATHWFPVSRSLTLVGIDMLTYLQKERLADHPRAGDALFKLCAKVRDDELITYYLEDTDDIGRVLNIFVRLNRAGTTLSYPDLLLSAATTSWKRRDARTAFDDVLAKVNRDRFDFRKDRILKAGMVLSGFEDIKFKAETFRAENATRLEHHWSEVARALPVASELLASFGLDEHTLTAENVIIPVAYYVKRRNLTSSNYVQLNRTSRDRDLLRSFVLRSLLKGSFWTGAVDPVLIETRRVIDEHGASQFPLRDLERAVSLVHKTLLFKAEEIDALLDSKAGRRTTRLVLSLLYPGLDLTGEFHQDHVFPRGRITERRLRALGLDSESILRAMAVRETVPNLQLLAGPLNREKAKKSVMQYLDTIKPESKRRNYVQLNDFPFEPEDDSAFLEFYDARRANMHKRLQELLHGPI